MQRKRKRSLVQLPQSSCFLLKILIHGNWPVKSMPRHERVWHDQMSVWFLPPSVSSNWAIQPGDWKSKFSLSCTCCIYPSRISTKLSRDLAERGGSLLAEKLVINLGGFVQDLKAAFRICRRRCVQPGVRRVCELQRTRGAWQGKTQVRMPSEYSLSKRELEVQTIVWVYKLFLLLQRVK